MDVRCEKCQTEYELDESRLKPGGVTVKCTNCGHMFKIRKRTNTNVGVPVVGEAPRTRPNSSKPPVAGSDRSSRADSVLGSMSDQGSGPNQTERQWLIRLENGEQKSCRELATLQQWIVAGVVTRESLISRSGKTWKRLGDITELGQYFTIADEARAQRSVKPTNQPQDKVRGTMMGVGAAKIASAGGTILPDEEDGRTTGNFRARPPTPPPPPPARTPPVGSPKANPMAQTELSAQMPVVKRPPTQPPPIPQGNRATAGWATNDIKASESMAAMPQGPQGGKLSAIPDEPAFAGRVRVSPTDESAFKTGKVTSIDDDDDMIPGGERGSKAGLVIAVIAMIVIGAAAGVVYMTVFNKKKTGEQATKPPADAMALVVATPDAAAIVTPITLDAAVAASSPLDEARTTIAANVDKGMRAALDSLASKDDPAALAVRARIETAIAQALQDRAGLVEKPEGDKARKEAKQLVIDAAVLAQKSLKAQSDDPMANLAMADVLRLQNKSARDVTRYIDQARAKAGTDKELAHEIALSAGMLAARDGKLDEAQKQLAEADTDPADVRAKLELALIAFAQNKPADAKAFVEQVVATQPDHAGAKALQAKLDTTVVKTDPLPPEDGNKGSGATHVRPPDNGGGGGGGDYDSLLARANKIAETNCGKAMDIFQRALEQKPNGVEALTGMGYCHIDAKQFASAFSKFRAALAVSSRYEPALGGVAEAYQQQGRKEQAIEAWKAYLEVYPNSAKAKKQLEILGPAPEPSGSGTAPPPPTPPPAPAPAPVPAPAGSGSG